MFNMPLFVVAAAEEQRQDKTEQRIARRVLRDGSNPLDLPQTLLVQ